jgi:hypothetical protein
VSTVTALRHRASEGLAMSQPLDVKMGIGVKKIRLGEGLGLGLGLGEGLGLGLVLGLLYDWS